MSSLGSSLRSAAQATFSAYRRVPVRWRLGGGSAALTLVILAVFAIATDVLINRHVSSSFYQSEAGAAQQFVGDAHVTVHDEIVTCSDAIYSYGQAQNAQIRIFSSDGRLLCSSQLDAGQPHNKPHFSFPITGGLNYVENGYRIYTEALKLAPRGSGVIVYAEPLSSLNEILNDVRLFLAGGVLGGAVLALLAGLLVAQRAMRPVVELTEAAREIERTRNPALRIPHPEAEDEVAELARTLESMLGALGAARAESEAALLRQREFVADASHELRTPLTAVFGNLELLADELEGEQAESANSALRSTRRMRRLVADLLLLARADVGRKQSVAPTDLAERLTEAAAELGPGLDEHELTLDPHPAPVAGVSDDLHRLILNLLENALAHTPAGTRICACTEIRDGLPTLVIEDDGPGIEPAMQSRVFERFVRGGGDTGSGARGTGLGLAIVDAVAASHHATVRLTSIPDVQGTRFEIVFPPLRERSGVTAGAADGELEAAGTQTSTTTGRTIGRRRNRS